MARGVTDEVTFQAKKLKENKSLLKMNSPKETKLAPGPLFKRFYYCLREQRDGTF